MVKISSLHQQFLNSIKTPVKRGKNLPFQSYLNKYQEHTHLVHDLIYYKKTIPEDKIVVIQKIIEDCSKIYEALLPLYQLGIHFSLGLAGGAIRDLLLDRHHQIKDLDIVLSIRIPNMGTKKYDYKTKKYKSVTRTVLSNPDLHRDLYEKIGFDVFEHMWFSQHTSDSVKTYEILKFLLSKKHTYEQCYSPFKSTPIKKDNEEDSDMPEYGKSLLAGVLKINTLGLHYPVDILITQANIQNYVNIFDFHICKAHIFLVDSEKTLLSKFNFPENPKDFLSHYVPCYDFLEDVRKKTITMDLVYRSIKDSKNSLENHLLRIEHKYPDYEQVFPMSHPDIINKKEKESLIHHYILSKQLSTPLHEEIVSRPKL